MTNLKYQSCGMLMSLSDPVLVDIANELVRRMRAGSNRPVVFMPWNGEFGIMLLYWVRYVHHFRASRKIVCCRRGDESYFPSASEFWYEFPEMADDSRKRGAMHHLNRTGPMTALQSTLAGIYGDLDFQFPFGEYAFAPFADLAVPFSPSPRRGLKVDIAVGARSRRYKSQKNWPHWGDLVARLEDRGYRVGLVGKRSTSYDSPAASLRAWECGDDAAANIEILQACRVYVGSDTGTSHLAAMVSAPAVIFRYPNRSSHLPQMRATSRSRVDFVPNGWNDPEAVWEAVDRAARLSDGRSTS